MADIWSSIYQYLVPYMSILQIILIIIVAGIIFSLILKLIKKSLLKRVKTKKQVSNVSTFIDLLKFLFVIFLLIIVFSSYYGRWSDFGFIAGLLTVAIGWALQKPISGVVAWLILTIRRPIHIGDRVIISDIKGDITNITLTHIFLDEVGGTIVGEEKSGRTVMLRQQQGHTMLAPYQDNMRLTRKLVAYQILRLIPQVYSAARLVRYVSDTGEMQSMTMTPEGIKKLQAIQLLQNDITISTYDISISESPSTPTTRQAEFMELLELIKEGVLPLTPAIIKMVIKASDISVKSELLSILEQEMQAMQQQQQQAKVTDALLK